jgi:hypothetical protein
MVLAAVAAFFTRSYRVISTQYLKGAEPQDDEQVDVETAAALKGQLPD